MKSRKKATSGRKKYFKGLVDVPVSLGKLTFINATKGFSLVDTNEGNEFIFFAEGSVKADEDGVGGWSEAATKAQ